MQTYQLFIGENNDTKEVEKSLIENVLNKHYEGYTIIDSVGYWLGKKENSVVITVVSDYKLLNEVLGELKEVLKQDAIAWQKVPMLQFF